MDEIISTTLSTYPQEIRQALLLLRQEIFDVAKAEEINDLTECLKWGQLSYTAKHGSTIRIDRKKNTTDQYAMYFHCQTKLVATFRELYPTTFSYVGNREINFLLDQEVPLLPLRHCIAMALKYHVLKQLPLLGG